MTRSGAPSTGRRDLRIDAVRGVALVLMYLAHCAPSPGPAKVLNLSEYATYPLFALLVGIGAALGSRSASRRWWVGPLVRGAVLVAVGEVLERQHTQVWIVLGFLGVLTWLAAPLARARPAVVAGIGLMALGLAPWLNDRGATWTPNEFPGGLTGLHLAWFLVVGGPGFREPYQLASMVFFAAVGILLSHYLLGTDVGDRRRLAIGVACGFASAGWLALEQAGVFEMVPYDVSYRVLLFDALLIVAITLVVAALAGRVRGLAAPSRPWERCPSRCIASRSPGSPTTSACCTPAPATTLGSTSQCSSPVRWSSRSPGGPRYGSSRGGGARSRDRWRSWSGPLPQSGPVPDATTSGPSAREACLRQRGHRSRTHLGMSGRSGGADTRW